MSTPPPAAAPAPGGKAARVCLGRIVGAHGVRGQVRIKLFAETAEALRAYGPLADEAGGRSLSIRSTAPGKAPDLVVATIDGIGDRDAADALRGVTLWVDRAALPPVEDEDTFYHADLIGLAADLVGGTPLGTVRAVHDFGAGEMLEIADPAGRPVMVPFTRAAVPVVDLAARRVIVDPPAGLLDPAGPPPAGEGAEEEAAPPRPGRRTGP